VLDRVKSMLAKTLPLGWLGLTPPRTVNGTDHHDEPARAAAAVTSSEARDTATPVAEPAGASRPWPSEPLQEVRCTERKLSLAPDTADTGQVRFPSSGLRPDPTAATRHGPTRPSDAAGRSYAGAGHFRRRPRRPGGLVHRYEYATVSAQPEAVFTTVLTT